MDTALRAAAGFQSVAAELLGVSPSTVCRFIQKHPKLNDTLDEITNELNDIAGSKLVMAIRDGESWAIKYYLDNKGQALGFGQRKLAFRDGDGQMVVPGVLILDGKLTQEEWEARYGGQAPETAPA